MPMHMDSASLYQLVELFKQQPKRPDQYYPWLGQTAYKTTYALLTCNINISQAPSRTSGAASGLYSLLTRNLAPYVQAAPARNLAISDAQLSANTIKWCDDNIEAIKAVALRLFADQVNFIHWADWAVENAWLEHSGRLGGLFNAEYSATISKVVEEDLAVLEFFQKNEL